MSSIVWASLRVSSYFQILLFRVEAIFFYLFPLDVIQSLVWHERGVIKSINVIVKGIRESVVGLP